MVNKETEEMYFRLRKEAFANYNNYEIGVVSGIMSGLILTGSTFVFTHMVGENFMSFIIAFIASLCVLVLFYYLFVVNHIRKQKQRWDELGRAQGIAVRAV